MYDNDKTVGFIAVIHFPHPVNPKIKHISRLVILPDYQGIGLGTKFLNAVSDLYINQGFDVSIVTSAKNLIHSLKRNNEWALIRYGKMNKADTRSKVGQNLKRTNSHNRNTATFFKKQIVKY